MRTRATGQATRISSRGSAPFPRTALVALQFLAIGASSRSLDSRPLESVASEQDGEPSATTKFLPAEACQPCHPQHFEEWRGSMHAYSIADPVFHAMNSFGQKDTGGALGDFCTRCHAPIGAIEGTVAPDVTNFEEIPSPASDGISCEVCHRGVSLRPGHPSNASLDHEPGGPMLGGIADPVPNGFHASRPSDLLRRPEFCGACHNVTNERGVRVEKPYDEHVASPFPERFVGCIDCHMQVYSGRATPDGPIRPRLHRHDFVGVDVALTPFPRAALQRREVEAFLRTAATLTVRAPSEVESGAEFVIGVDVKNSGAGHNLPTGPSTERQLWIEVTATTPSGDIVFASGHLDERGDLREPHARADGEGERADPWLALFTDHFEDENGRFVPFLWQAHRLVEGTIPPLETRSARYPVTISKELASERVSVRVRLLFRAFPPHQLRRLGIGELVDRFPIFVVGEHTIPEIRILRGRRSGLRRVPEDDPTIAAAIAAARDGDVVLVGSGTFVIDQTIDPGGKRLTLRANGGEDGTRLVVGPELDGAPLLRCSSGERWDLRVEGFTFVGTAHGVAPGSTARSRAIEISGSDPLIARNAFIDFESSGDGAALSIRDSYAHLLANRFEDCRAAGRGGALVVTGSSGVLVEDCEFIDVRALEGGAIAAAGGTVVVRGRFERAVAVRGGAIHIVESRTDAAGVRIQAVEFVSCSSEFGAALGAEGSVRIDFSRNLVAGSLGTAISIARGASLEGHRTTLVDTLGGAALALDAESSARFSSSAFFGNRAGTIAGDVSWSMTDDTTLAQATNRVVHPSFEDPPGRWERSLAPDVPGFVPLVRGGDANPRAPSLWRRYIRGRYRPLLESPLIDAGDPSAAPDPDGTRPDIGSIWVPKPRHLFRRGDVDGNGRRDLVDLRATADAVFFGRVPRCAEAADFDADGHLHPSDVALAAATLLVRPQRLPDPFPGCGPGISGPGGGPGCFESTCVPDLR
jgi:hypothetical protein